ncbi:heat shock protein GrpE [Psychroflexus torquis ATCC 700755]|uniref:Protein GrpE n=1 Tax=Psychroflexus torquis (strain ATCC 700755 / CIP 106069 / ACAM 623) TaxID=313595 RepID=K4IV32_PSYTT|nr:nucleotide exchange factor GrpE [Psychroflexus torquis]AFU69335.1 heat shock protein GrpE [Psychroflexus torquis ATCC 700755]
MSENKSNKDDIESTQNDVDVNSEVETSEVHEQQSDEVGDTPEVELSTEERLQQELDAKDDKYLRLFAEFENYKRRTSKERMELFKTASQDVMQAMLPVLDDFDRALLQIKKSEDESLVEGIELINTKLRETLIHRGLEVMSIKEGDAFDSELHEAITQVPSPSEDMKGKIIDVVEKGYTLGDKIIRYPKVVTGK